MTADTNNVPLRPPQAAGMTRARLSEETGVPMVFLDDLGLSDANVPDPVVRFPISDASGNEIGVRFLTSVDQPQRNRWRSGSKSTLLGLDCLRLAKQARRIVLLMGEGDLICLRHIVEPALGLARPNDWHDDRYLPLLEGIDDIILVVSNRNRDELLERFERSPLQTRLRLLDLESTTITTLHREDPEDFAARWEELLETAVPLSGSDDAERERQRDESYALAESLLYDPDLLGRIGNAFRQLGYAGDLNPVLLAYLALTSRLVEHPLKLVFVAESGIGKSHTVDTAVRLMPDGAVYKLSAATPLAAIYANFEFKHKVLYYAEADSLPEEGAAAAGMRSLISDAKLVYEVVELDPALGRMGTRRIEKEGPTGFITTFTKPLSRQFNTRTLEIRLDATPAQTKAIMRAHARSVMAGGRTYVDLTSFVAVQTYLEHSGIHQVIVPFADALTEALPETDTRMRRDIRQLLTVVQASALLHQCQRQFTPDGAVIAQIEDYVIARQLLAKHFARTVADRLTPAIRQTVEAVGPGESLTITEIQTRLGLKSLASAHERVRRAIAGGWLVNRETRRGHPAIIQRGAPLPDAASVLPTVEQLLEGFGPSG